MNQDAQNFAGGLNQDRTLYNKRAGDLLQNLQKDLQKEKPKE